MEIYAGATMLLLQRVVHTIFPARCPGCGSDHGSICEECLGRIISIRAQGCFYCGRLARSGKTCQACRRRTPLSGVVVGAHYESPLREAIWEFKYGGRRGLAPILAGLLRSEVELSRATALVPLPLARRREWWRGYNQARELARALSETRPVIDGLRRTRETKPQVELTRRERLVNLEGAFLAQPGLPHRALLVDDVATTGASLEAAAEALRAVGVREVWAAVLARHK